MIKLYEKYNRIFLQFPYSEEVKNKVASIPDRRWDYENKEWNIPYASLPYLYNRFEENFIQAPIEATNYLKFLNGKSHYVLRRIRENVIELKYSYSMDIADVVKSFPYRYKIGINHYLINDEEAKDLIHKIGKERAVFDTEKSEYLELYEAGDEALELEYDDPVVVIHCTGLHGKVLHSLIPAIGFNYRKKRYQIPLHKINDLNALVGSQNITMDEQTRLHLQELYKKELPIADRLKDIKPVIDYDFKTKPLPHQVEAFNEGMKHNRILIADSPGLGKTMEALNIACARVQRDGLPRNVLIVCGVNSVKYNWEEEIGKHTNEKGVIFEGTTQKKLKLIDEWLGNGDELFGIINIESLRNEQICEKLKESIGVIVVDEIHKAKNGNSQQGKALRELNADVKIGLSGTPMTNKPEDLWNILAWLDVEQQNYWQFRKEYCIMGGMKNRQIVDYKNLDDLSMFLKEVMLRRKKEDVIDLPPKTYKTEYVELTKDQKKLYADAKNGVLQILDEVLAANNPLTYLLRMRQVTSGLGVETKDDAKFKRIKEIIDESIVPNGEKVILFSQYEQTANEYKEALAEYNPAYIVGKVSVEDRQNEVNRFQNDADCKVAIGTIGAMGTGLTMTAASYVIFIDKDWAQTNNEQAEDRAHRIGTKKNVTIISVVAKDTVDEHIEDVLKEKKMMFDNVVEGKAVSNSTRKALVCEILGVPMPKEEKEGGND